MNLRRLFGVMLFGAIAGISIPAIAGFQHHASYYPGQKASEPFSCTVFDDPNSSGKCESFCAKYKQDHQSGSCTCYVGGC